MKKNTNKNFIKVIEEGVANKTGESRLIILKEGIEILSKERMAHLIVTMSVLLYMIIFFSLSMILSQPLIFALFFITLILSCFYVWHYFVLENSISRFYGLYMEVLEERNK